MMNTLSSRRKRRSLVALPFFGISPISQYSSLASFFG
uniref:Uncharacterized protein n=1 Tax=Arundo donax TaxID=35708 RepID=A0A0A9FXG5_ARUDO